MPGNHDIINYRDQRKVAHINTHTQHQAHVLARHIIFERTILNTIGALGVELQSESFTMTGSQDSATQTQQWQRCYLVFSIFVEMIYNII